MLSVRQVRDIFATWATQSSLEAAANAMAVKRFRDRHELAAGSKCTFGALHSYAVDFVFRNVVVLFAVLRGWKHVVSALRAHRLRFCRNFCALIRTSGSVSRLTESWSRTIESTSVRKATSVPRLDNG